MIVFVVGLLLQGAVGEPAAWRGPPVARRAQVRFESLRRTRLPLGGGGDGPCDARVGRYCYWHDSTELAPPEEPESIREERRRLLSLIDSLAVAHPADPWLAGQRVRYLLEARRDSDAAAAAQACAADKWWCLALEGLTFHVRQEYEAADAAYMRALEAMPDTTRCRWFDLSELVESPLAREFETRTCAERETLADRLWRVAQPLWSFGGNDLRTEHFARQTMALIFARSANVQGTIWSDDSRELLLRYGWPEWYTRATPRPMSNTEPAVTGHDREPSYGFFPSVESPRQLEFMPAGAWRLRSATARSRYAPRHVKRFVDLRHQLVRVPRGDSMVVRAVFRVRDTALVNDVSRATLFLLTRDNRRFQAAFEENSARLTVPGDTVLASIEVVGTRNKHAARARYAVAPLSCTAFGCLGDLLLYAPDSTDGGQPGPALADSIVSVRAGLGVQWTFESPNATPASIEISVEPLRPGFVRRIAARLGLTEAPAAVRVRWQATLRPGAHAENTAVRLTRSARGAHRVALTVRPEGGPPHTTRRVIQLVP